ncbi:hypothetical protein [Streptosporangium sp. NPDC003464]
MPGHDETAPLILHGQQNAILRVTAAQTTARAVYGAQLMTIPGVGRDLPAILWPAVAREVRELAATLSTQPDAGHRRLSA